MLQSAFVKFRLLERRNLLVSLRFTGLPILLTIIAAAASVIGQDAPATPTPTPPAPIAAAGNSGQTYTAEQVAESSIFIYGLGGGRIILDQIRKTTFERGSIVLTNADGRNQNAQYQRWVIRGENSSTDKVRVEQEFPDARYSLIHNTDKIFGVYNDSIFTPRDDAKKAFENQTFRGLDALLRYKENESTLELHGREKIMGVDFYVVEVTDKQGRKTKFFISVKSLRVMILEYEDGGIKYTRRFYDYRNAQGTLVPYRTVLWADGKQVEETNVGTITFGQRVDESLFPAG